MIANNNSAFLSNYSFNFNKNFYEQLKSGEEGFKIPLNRKKYNLVRLDGASFSKQFKLRYARFDRKLPYNPYLSFAMQQTALDAMKEFPFIVYAYTFSDEISFLIDNSLIDFRKMSTLEKMISILSSFVSSAFNNNLYKVIDLKIDDLFVEQKLDVEKLKVYEQFLKNCAYLLYVAKRNQIPLNSSGIEKNEDADNIYKFCRYELSGAKKVKKEDLDKALNLFKSEIPFLEFKDHIFYFDARLISFDSEKRVYDYFKARQCFAIYKFVEDMSFSLLKKLPQIFQGNKNTNLYFKLLKEEGIPSSVYFAFDENLRLGTSLYKDNANSIFARSAKELRNNDDEILIKTISNVLDEEIVSLTKESNSNDD